MSTITRDQILEDAAGHYLEQTIKLKDGTEQTFYIIERWVDKNNKVHYSDLKNSQKENNTVNEINRIVKESIEDQLLNNQSNQNIDSLDYIRVRYDQNYNYIEDQWVFLDSSNKNDPKKSLNNDVQVLKPQSKQSNNKTNSSRWENLAKKVQKCTDRNSRFKSNPISHALFQGGMDSENIQKQIKKTEPQLKNTTQQSTGSQSGSSPLFPEWKRLFGESETDDSSLASDSFSTIFENQPSAPDSQDLPKDLPKVSKHNVQSYLNKPHSYKNLPKWRLRKMDLGPPVGLKNSQNDCYMNAMLQMAFNDPDFFHYAIARDDQNEEIRNLAQDYFNRQIAQKKPDNPPNQEKLFLAQKFRKALGSKQFNENLNEMHDSGEALLQLFPGSRKLKADSKDEEAGNPFKFELVIERHFPEKLLFIKGSNVKKEDQHVKVCSSSGFIFNLPIHSQEEKPIPFQDMLASYFNRGKDKVGSSKYELEGTEGQTLNLVPDWENTRFKELPKKWVCRFHRTHLNGSKKTQAVKIDQKFILDKRFTESGKSGRYEITSFVVHGSSKQASFGQGGTAKDGHYISYVKNNGQWYRCNDIDVQRVDDKEIKKQLPYCYFFNSQLIEENPSENSSSKD